MNFCTIALIHDSWNEHFNNDTKRKYQFHARIIQFIMREFACAVNSICVFIEYHNLITTGINRFNYCYILATC